jgi:hypothetical protein
VELYPVVDVSAKSACLAMLNHAGRYGCPDTLLSDRGSQFVNGIITELLTMLQVSHDLTIAYSKEENSIVERANKEVMRHLRAMLMERNILDEWEQYIPLVQRIINSKVHESTGVSPSKLLFGNMIDLDNQLLYEVQPSVLNNLSLSEWSQKMLLNQKKLIEIAQKTQFELDKKNLSQRPLNETVIPTNSYVLVKYPKSPSKLMMPNAGPFKVTGVTLGKASLLNLVSNKEKHVHVSRLIPYFDNQHDLPRVIANTDTNVWDVEAIVSHKGTKKSNFLFEVKWIGFDSSENS